MKKLVLGLATIFMFLLGSITPAFAYDANGNPEYGDPGFDPYTQMTEEELHEAQRKSIEESMTPKERLMKNGFSIWFVFVFGLMVVIVIASVSDSINNKRETSRLSDDMKEWSKNASTNNSNNTSTNEYQVNVHATIDRTENADNLFDDDYLI